MYFNFWFCFFAWNPIRIASSAIGLKICAIVAKIKKYKSIIKKHSIEVLISKALIDSKISHNKFVLINSVLKTIWRFERRN